MNRLDIQAALTVCIAAFATPGSTSVAASLEPPARCFAGAGLVWPLGEAGWPRNRVAVWLILLPTEQGRDSTDGRADAADTVGNAISGSWRRLGSDSLLIQLADLFTSSALRLALVRGGVSGIGSGTTDEVSEIKPGVFEPKRHTWSVRLRQAQCERVPRRLWPPPSAA